MLVDGWNLSQYLLWSTIDERVDFRYFESGWAAIAYTDGDRQLLDEAGLLATETGLSLRALASIVSEATGASARLTRGIAPWYNIDGTSLMVVRNRDKPGWFIERNVSADGVYEYAYTVLQGQAFSTRKAALAALGEFCAPPTSVVSNNPD